jgi:hypothetical protein
LLGLVFLASARAAFAVPIVPRFSLDPASPSNSGGINPADVLGSGPVVVIPGASLGLQTNYPAGAYDNLNEVSFGQEPIRNPLYFSVDRVSVGVPGSAVFNEAQPGVASAAGDVFVSLPPFGTNALFIPETALGLVPGFFGDDIDALELDTFPNPFIYFTIDALSATNGFGTGTLAKDILLSTGGGSFSVYADGTLFNLDPFDDLDGLVLDDRFQPGVLNPGIDKALFSLTPFSPSTFTFTGNSYVPGVKGSLSPADILFTDFTGSFSLWASAADIGLLPGDNVDALDTVVPEPATWFLLASALPALAVTRRAVRRGRRRASGAGGYSAVTIVSAELSSGEPIS